MDKILSVIIPTYNMEKYLHHTLSSLLIGKKQELLDVMIVNDGSKDSSFSIGKEFESKYPDTFRVIDKENGNYGSCINRGLQEAKGKYIKILDADDSYDTSAFSILIEKLLTVDVDLVLTDYVKVNENGKQGGKHVRSYLPHNKIIDAATLWQTVGKDIIEMHEIVYRTENLNRINYHQTEGIAFTDQEWILMPMKTVETAYYLPISVYKYLVGREGQSVDISRAARLQSQGNKSMFVQLEKYNLCNDISEHLRKYFIAHLSQNLKFTYRTYLITAYKAFNGNEIKEFDDRLKIASRHLYDNISYETVHPRIPLHFIKLWRDNGYEATFSIKFYRTCIYPILRFFHLG